MILLDPFQGNMRYLVMAHVMLFYLKSRVVCCQEAAIERSIDYDCQGVVVRVGLPLSLSVCVCVCVTLSMEG